MRGMEIVIIKTNVASFEVICVWICVVLVVQILFSLQIDCFILFFWGGEGREGGGLCKQIICFIYIYTLYIHELWFLVMKLLFKSFHWEALYRFDSPLDN